MSKRLFDRRLIRRAVNDMSASYDTVLWLKGPRHFENFRVNHLLIYVLFDYQDDGRREDEHEGF